MKATTTFFIVASLIFATLFFGCNQTNPPTAPTQQQMIIRGDYLVNTIGACADCHSPKIFMPDGSFVPDTSRYLSGHPAGTKLPPIDTSEIVPGKWYLIGSDLTTFVGPWGISYTANLTPDSITGLGAWTEENFINTMRKGKHLGQDGGRPILPPMPWYYLAKMTDEDLKSVFAYLKSLKPVSNQVPSPVPPPDVAKMGSVTQ